MSSNFVCSCNAAALHMASANGHLDIVDYLIRNGAVRAIHLKLITCFVFDTVSLSI